ncbi:MAG: hypothetical protein WEE50_05180 [Chloroflexota bacterium]
MFRIRRFGVIRTANVVAFLYVVIIAVIFVPIALLFAVAVPGSGLAGNAGGIAIVFFGLLLAIFYGIVGWIFTAIACLLYNFAAGMIGGIEIQLEAVQPPPQAAVWGATPTGPPPPAAPATPPPSSAPPS